MNKVIYLAIVCLALSGCADSSTKGNVKDVAADITIEIHDNTGPIYLDPSLGFKYAMGDTNQDTKNSSDLNPVTDLKVPIAQGASSAVTGAAEGLKNVLDNSIKDSNNKPIPVIVPKEEKEVVAPGEKTTTFDMEYRPEHNRLFTWLPETGSYYGGPITISVCDKTMSVPDATKEAKGDLIWFPGTTKTGAENNNNRASVFGPVGCKAGELTIL